MVNCRSLHDLTFGVPSAEGEDLTVHGNPSDVDVPRRDEGVELSGGQVEVPSNVAGAKVNPIRDRFPKSVLKVRVNRFLNNGAKRAWIIVEGWSIDREDTDVRVAPTAVKGGENPKRDEMGHLGFVDQVGEHNTVTTNSFTLSHGRHSASPCFVRLDKKNLGKGVNRKDFPVLVYPCVSDADYIASSATFWDLW